MRVRVRVSPRCRRGRSAASLIHAHYLLQHRHQPRECGVVFASFKGHESPLRHQTTVASCRSDGHAIWWTVDAASEEEARRLLPLYVAERSTVVCVSGVEIP
jgi:hypothetical protein